MVITLNPLMMKVVYFKKDGKQLKMEVYSKPRNKYMIRFAKNKNH